MRNEYSGPAYFYREDTFGPYPDAKPQREKDSHHSMCRIEEHGVCLCDQLYEEDYLL